MFTKSELAQIADFCQREAAFRNNLERRLTRSSASTKKNPCLAAILGERMNGIGLSYGRRRDRSTRNCRPSDQTSPSDLASFPIVDLARAAAIYRLRSRRGLASARRYIFRPANRAAWNRCRDWWKFSLRRAAGHRHDENFVVRAGGFDFIDVAGVSQLLAVGRNRIHVLPAEMERRHIVIARREIARLSL